MGQQAGRHPVRQEREPAGDDVREVSPGILRLQLPIDMPGLGHVNCYAIADRRGYAVIDPGLPGRKSWRALRRRLRSAGIRIGDIHTILVTHTHPDHSGAAGRLAKASGAALITHSAFRPWWAPKSIHVCDQIHDIDPDDLPEGNPFTEAPPWDGHSPPAANERLSWRIRSVAMARVFAAPTPTRRVRDGETVVLGDREWVAVHTPGHTLEHFCLYHPDEGTLLSGDHVLPTITPHISGLGEGRDPLRHYIDSLDKVASLPRVATVLPAHGHPFADLDGRVNSIKAHHVERMEALRQASVALGPSTVTELSHHLFRRPAWGPMAESETYAHLEHLRLAGEAERYDDGKRRLVYRVTASSAA
jgi:glyoxylase-like metal-dependent hydrolase (beta-lactamase superfamily II)